MPRLRFHSANQPTAPEKPTPEEGYDYVLAEKPRRDLQTECPICQLLLRDPCQLKCCGTLICAVCLTNTFRKGHKLCPLCRKSNPSFFTDKHQKRIIEGLSVFCKHQASEQGAGEGGCEWVGELGQVEHHLNTNPSSHKERMKGCQYVLLKCKYCQEEIFRMNLIVHEKNLCPQRQTECPYCGYVGSHEVVTGPHLKKCVNYPIPCEYCKELVKNGYMDHHIREECPFFPVACSLQEYGCTKKIPRVEMADHMTNSQAKHINMLKECLRVMKRDKEAEILKLSSAIAKISSHKRDNEAKLFSRIAELSSQKKDKEAKLSYRIAKLSSENEHLFAHIKELHSTVYCQQIRLRMLRDRCSELEQRAEQTPVSENYRTVIIVVVVIIPIAIIIIMYNIL